jgi:hypothetical protein
MSDNMYAAFGHGQMQLSKFDRYLLVQVLTFLAVTRHQRHLWGGYRVDARGLFGRRLDLRGRQA